MSSNKNNEISSSESILLEDLTGNGIFRIVLNDSKRRNALSEEMMAALKSSLTKAAENQNIRTVIIAANGPAFCSGHDLKQMTAGRDNDDQGLAYFKKVFASCSELMQMIVSLPKPIIAEVSGVAAAAGCQLVACCDLAVAGKSARFITPGVNIGLFCSTPMVALSRNVSNKAAMEMLLTGEMVSAEKAEHIGLINRVTKDANVVQSTIALAEVIASKSSQTLKIGKEAFYKQKNMPLSEAYDYASKVMVDNMLEHDAKEGIDSFLQKRKPKWQDN
ncbi:enoyl-CoA hydratase [Candidatus Pseudothioglobus singularis]|nr:enoyl-CoA hydratase [Candidatus Pseudothioglobus singularis]MDB4598203.1 enoyl-CoA hydratase [Candidatus Pseudothioglobus singularis]|tara:strand:+ start:814 stop:1641 length:828 start_codon:yes stop_codon:yes gene_type:complete